MPGKEKFYSSLTTKKKKISDKEYEHVLKAWDKFEIKTMKDYHNLYIIYGVLLLADVFKKIIKSSKIYGLCLSYYLSAPALSWMEWLVRQKLGLNLFQLTGGAFYISKGCSCYKTITSQNVSSEVQVKSLFILWKSYVTFSRCSSFCIINHPMIYEVCDVMMSIKTWGRVHFWICIFRTTTD